MRPTYQILPDDSPLFTADGRRVKVALCEETGTSIRICRRGYLYRVIGVSPKMNIISASMASMASLTSCTWGLINERDQVIAELNE